MSDAHGDQFERIGDVPVIDLDLYALDALPADEALAVRRTLEGADPGDQRSMEEHIAGTREVAASVVAGAGLDVAPPQHLRGEILDRIASQRAEEEPVTTPTPIRGRRRRRPAALLAAAAAAVVLLAGGVAIGRFTADAPGDDPPTAAPPADQPAGEGGMPETVATLLAADDLTVNRGSVEGDGSATLLASRSRDTAMLSMFGLPELDQGRAYQLWLIGPDHEPIPSGTMEAGTVDAEATAEFHDVADSASVGLTEEPAGGSPAPTGEILMALELD